MSKQYEQNLQASLQELSNAYDQQMAENKACFSAAYDKKILDHRISCPLSNCISLLSLR